MIHHYASSRLKCGTMKHYRYYVCTRAQKDGWNRCPQPSLPAQELENFIVDQIRSLGHDDALLAESVREAQSQLRDRVEQLNVERSCLLEQLENAREELRELVETGRDRNGSIARASGLREEIRTMTAQDRRLIKRIDVMQERVLDEDELVGAFESFDPMWNALTTTERERFVRLLVSSVEYDAENETVSVSFHASENAMDEEAECQATQ